MSSDNYSPSYSPTSPSYCPTSPSYVPPPTPPKKLPKASSPPPSPYSPTSAISPPPTKRARFSIDDGKRNAAGAMTATSSGERPPLAFGVPPPPRMEVIECWNCKKKGHEAVDCRAYVKEGYRRYGTCSDKELHS